MIITISGTPGSGKSTISKILITELHAEYINAGMARRELARKKGISLEQLNEYAKTHPETDIDVDKECSERAGSLNKEGKTVVSEGRVQFHFLPESVKIYIKVNPEIGAQRIWKDLQQEERKLKRNEGEYSSFEELKQGIKEREEKDSKRYLKYYKIDHRDESHYDLVIDTTKLNPEQAAKKILKFIEDEKKINNSL